MGTGGGSFGLKQGDGISVFILKTLSTGQLEGSRLVTGFHLRCREGVKGRAGPTGDPCREGVTGGAWAWGVLGAFGPGPRKETQLEASCRLSVGLKTWSNVAICTCDDECRRSGGYSFPQIGAARKSPAVALNTAQTGTTQAAGSGPRPALDQRARSLDGRHVGDQNGGQGHSISGGEGTPRIPSRSSGLTPIRSRRSRGRITMFIVDSWLPPGYHR